MRPNPSLKGEPQRRGTLGLRRWGFAPILRRSPSAPHRWAHLSSNVRPHSIESSASINSARPSGLALTSSVKEWTLSSQRRMWGLVALSLCVGARGGATKEPTRRTLSPRLRIQRGKLGALRVTSLCALAAGPSHSAA
jgi:hypothetical protein